MSAVQKNTEPAAARAACRAVAGSAALPANEAIADAERASASANPDARLIELGRRYAIQQGDFVEASRRCERAYKVAKIDTTIAHPEDDPDYLEAKNAADALLERVSDLEQEILESPASTLDGLRVKALVAHNNREPDDHDLGYGDAAAYSVVDFILGHGSGPAHVPVSSVAEAVLPALPQFSLDGLEGRHLDILFDLFLAIENIAMGIVNQPRCDQGGTKEVLLNEGGEIVEHVHEWATAARDLIGKYADTSVALDVHDAENRRWVAIKNLAHYQCTLSEVVIAATKQGRVQP